ncbi:dCTP deaminase domain-containing protein [Gordonibacter massiliensis (ex Traore et al. 2017)]|uniref:Deoxycytidine triphosphate deaminase n=1 Tax=Gordonibacter massiliensis (ex Traore et al. 2017) TaxID=1841863 RepID=A0A842JE81_9ACTN|nr:hypothetical protein [Gordonibacter massiliensis (ex Traore et al. 2017)]MBC2889987.1 hypothetical protein [Gordonibacter massiliensis (ex Traore et al. 2017)]
MLSREDIKRAIVDGKVKIYPFESKNMTGIGYNLSTTNFAFSIGRGVLLPIRKDTTSSGVSHYVFIPPCDTVLFFSREYVSVDGTLAGSFYSKVSRVCQGLGHISTTLDPTWKGQLILSVNNPTDRRIRFDLDKDSGNVATMLLHDLDTPVSGPDIHDNNRGRCDLLLGHFTDPPRRGKNRRKHLELRDFVVHEYADSLNGYDDFLTADAPRDRYSKKVDELRELRERLNEDVRSIREEKYSLGQGGHYFALRSDSERQLINGCALYGLYDGERLEKLAAIESESGGASVCESQTAEAVELYLDIIDYELEMINHIRRINWQNERVHEYADEKSTLSKEQERARFWSNVGSMGGYLAAAIMLAAALIYAIACAQPENLMALLVPVLVAAFVPLTIAAIGRWGDLTSRQPTRKGGK